MRSTQTKDVKQEISESEIEDFEKKYKETYDLLLREKPKWRISRKEQKKRLKMHTTLKVESLLSEIIPIYDSLLLSSKIDKDKVKIDQLVKGNELLSPFKQILKKII